MQTRTLVATAVESSDDEIDIAVGESCIAASPFSRPRRSRRAPTFEHLGIVAPRSPVWLYVATLGVALVGCLLLAVR